MQTPCAHLDGNRRAFRLKNLGRFANINYHQLLWLGAIRIEYTHCCFRLQKERQSTTYRNPQKYVLLFHRLLSLYRYILQDDGKYPYIAKATGSNGVVIGFCHDHPEYDVDPIKGYTENQAKTADMLRKCGVETVFSDVRTVPAKTSEAITAGLYVEWSADGWKKTASSGTTKSDAICLIGQTSDNEIVIGLK